MPSFCLCYALCNKTYSPFEWLVSGFLILRVTKHIHLFHAPERSIFPLVFVYLLQEITVHLVQNSERNGCFKTASVKLDYLQKGQKLKFGKNNETCHIGVIFDVKFENWAHFSVGHSSCTTQYIHSVCNAGQCHLAESSADPVH